MTGEIVTKRLLLREVSHKDTHSLFEIWSNPKITEFMNISPMTDKEQAIEMIRFFQKLSKSNNGNRYSIIHRETNQLIG
ncbi:GNAT family N-acetyltransferase, partial [Bacillus sp. JJ722]|uniref:GNAT family N-acetyltransferase n=1 Tax=Bacillus sp. JJ722 TaxID=3122973 RepID=UPI003000DED4